MDLLDRVRAICMDLPGVTERVSHGAPSWFIGKSPQFANFTVNHHGVDWTAVWAAAPVGAQEALASSEPDTYFVPPYFGYRGWIGIRLGERTDWDEVAEILDEAWRTVAPAKLLKGLNP